MALGRQKHLGQKGNKMFALESTMSASWCYWVCAVKLVGPQQSNPLLTLKKRSHTELIYILVATLPLNS